MYPRALCVHCLHRLRCRWLPPPLTSFLLPSTSFRLPPHPLHPSTNEHSVDADTALRSTVAMLKEAGWGRHTFLVPGLGYWILIPLYMWLLTISGFETACPAFLAPVQRACELKTLFITTANEPTLIPSVPPPFYFYCKLTPTNSKSFVPLINNCFSKVKFWYCYIVTNIVVTCCVLIVRIVVDRDTIVESCKTHNEWCIADAGQLSMRWLSREPGTHIYCISIIKQQSVLSLVIDTRYVLNKQNSVNIGCSSNGISKPWRNVPSARMPPTPTTTYIGGEFFFSRLAGVVCVRPCNIVILA